MGPEGSVEGDGNTPAGPRVTSLAHQLLAGQLVVLCAAAFANVLAALAMGPASRGELALLLHVVYVLHVLSVAGTDRAYPATVSTHPTLPQGLNAMRHLVGPGAALVTCGCVLVTTLVYPTPIVGFGYGMALAAMLLGSILMSSVRTASIAAISGRKYMQLSLLSQSILVGLASVLALSKETSPLIWLGGYAASMLLPALTIWWMLQRRSERGSRPDSSHVSAARRLGMRVLPSTAAGVIALRADRFLLPWLASYRQLGVYVVAATVTELLIVPVTNYVDAHTPTWRMAFLAGKLRIARIMTSAIAYAVFGVTTLIASAHFFLIPILGSEYQESRRVVIPLAIAAGLWSLSRVAVALALARGQSRPALIGDTSAMAASILCYLVLIPAHGAMGAALGSLVGYGVAALIAGMSCYLHPRRGGLNKSSQNRRHEDVYPKMEEAT